MQKPQPVIDRDLADARRHAGQAGGEIGTDSRKECPRLFNIFLLYGNCDVLLLDQVVALRRLIQQQIIVLTAVLVLSVAFHWHEQRPSEVLLVELPVEQRDLRRGSNGERIEKGAVGHKEFPLLFRRRHSIIDIKKAPSPRKLAAHLKYTVFVNALDGNRFLYAARNGKGIPLRAALMLKRSMFLHLVFHRFFIVVF